MGAGSEPARPRAPRSRNVRYSNGNARRKLRQRIRAEGNPCHLCGQAIDYSLPAGHPMSFEVDELVPVAMGGDPLAYDNCRAAHRICNERKGARLQWKPKPSQKPPSTSRAW